MGQGRTFTSSSKFLWSLDHYRYLLRIATDVAIEQNWENPEELVTEAWLRLARCYTAAQLRYNGKHFRTIMLRYICSSRLKDGPVHKEGDWENVQRNESLICFDMLYDEVDMIRAILDKLQFDNLADIILMKMAGWPTRDIATVLHITDQTVLNRLARHKNAICYAVFATASPEVL